MRELILLTEENLNQSLIQIIISNRRKASNEWKKVTIRPCEVGGKLLFQFSYFDEKQVRHKNLPMEEVLNEIESLLTSQFKQFEMTTVTMHVTALINKSGKAAIRKKLQKCKREPASLSHNRKKEYLLEEGIPVPFLFDLGVQTKEGEIVAKKYNKFRQINRFLEFVRDILPVLDKEREITILDFGCGKSYLTFAIYYYLVELNHYKVKMVGLDLKEDVINHCNRLKEAYGYEGLEFFVGDIGQYEGCSKVDMVVTLHACDTATDFALSKAVKWNAKVILSVPCCQHELNGQIKNELLAPVLKYGIIKERMSALLTDAMRANLLEQNGYEVQILEFIDMSHTPKNLLIRAVKVTEKVGEDKAFERLEDELHAKLTLRNLL